MLLIKAVIENQAVQLEVEIRVHLKAGTRNVVPALVEDFEVELAGRTQGMGAIEVDVAK